jgi:hypothetical protein
VDDRQVDGRRGVWTDWWLKNRVGGRAVGCVGDGGAGSPKEAAGVANKGGPQGRPETGVPKGGSLDGGTTMGIPRREVH